jgi:acyl-CoA synthetase (AMP-forming)/AMP-acid ligase II
MGGEMHIGAQLAQLALRHSDRIAIVDESGAWSFRRFHSRIIRFGNALRGLGLDKGDRVALLVPDIREYLEADYGTMAAGFVRVPMDPRLTRRELVDFLRHAGARALVTHASFAEKAGGLTSDVASLEFVIGIGGGAGLSYEALLEKASERPLAEAAGDDLATLNFSGGTTGAPKATMLRHRNLLTVVQHTIAGFDIGSDAVFLNVRPLWPIAQVILMSHLFAGATVVLGSRFDPEQLAARIKQTGATRTSLVPTQLVRWLDYLPNRAPKLAALQAIYVGGSRIPPTVFEQALAVIGPRIGVLYGLTEAPVTCYMPPRTLAVDADRRRLMESVGRELSGYQVRIATSEHGAAAGPDQPGEVLICGDNVMAGYWQNEAATRAALRDGWLHSGDIGQRDDAGNLYIVGRLSDVIRSGSSSIMPKEVEDVIVTHPAVGEVAVVGLPDTEWGEAVTAFVVVKPGAVVTERDLVEHCRKYLAGYKKPRSVRFVASLPRSHYGKVIKAQLIGEATTDVTRT